MKIAFYFVDERYIDFLKETEIRSRGFTTVAFHCSEKAFTSSSSGLTKFLIFLQFIIPAPFLFICHKYTIVYKKRQLSHLYLQYYFLHTYCKGLDFKAGGVKVVSSNDWEGWKV